MKRVKVYRNLSDIKLEFAELKEQESKAKAKLKSIEKALDSLYRTYPPLFRCNRCSKAFTIDQVGYKEQRTRKSNYDYQYGGEYSVYQSVELEYIACCPKCGKSFGVSVKPSDTIERTPTYHRHDGKDWNFKPEGKISGDETIHKVTKDMLQHIKHVLNID